MEDPTHQSDVATSGGSVLAVDDEALRDLSKKIGVEWERLATYLHVITSKIYSLKEDHMDAEDRIFHMLVFWRQSQVGQCDLVETLASALSKADRTDLATGFTESAMQLSDIVLRVLSSKLGSEWEELASYLECTAAEIHRSKMNDSTLKNQIFNLLVMWRQRQPTGTALKETIATALRQCERNDLAQKLMGCSAAAWLMPYMFDLKSCRKELSHFYKNDKGSISIVPYDDEGMVDIDDLYVELELLDEQPTTKEVRKIKLRSYDSLVELSKKKVLVRGGPGSGKTTLVSKMSYDWAKNVSEESGADKDESKTMCKFSLVLALNMRELLQEGMTLAEAVQDQLLPDDTVVTKEGLAAYISDNQNKVLVILDGYDEYPGGLSSGSKSKGANGRKKVHGGILEMLHDQQLIQCSLIVTSRPHRVSDFGKLHKHYSHVELTGFAKENVKKYIWKFFKVNDEGEDSLSDEEKENQSNTEKLLTEIETNSALATLAKTPVILALLCLLWQESQELPKRVTPLYDEAMMFLIRRWKVKSRDEESDDEPPDEDEVKEMSKALLMELGEVALNGLFEDKLIFSAKDFGVDIQKKACVAGILSKEKTRSKRAIGAMVQQVSFVHKTFQEMCGGTYLADLADSDPPRFDEYLKRLTDTNIGDLEYLLRFCCGLNEKAATLILPIAVTLSCNLMEKVGDDCRLGYDDIRQDPWRLPLLLLFESQCREEYHVLKTMFHRQKLRIRFHNTEVLVAVDFFLESLLLIDNRTDMLEQVSDTELVGIRAQDIPVASKLLKHMHAVKQLKLVFLSRSEYEEMEKLGSSLSHLNSLTSLSLEGRDCDVSGIMSKLASEPGCSKSIEEFSCHLSRFNTDALVIFISRQPSLVTLKLLDNKLKKEAVASLLYGIKDAKLQMLEIFWNEIGDSIAHIIPFLPSLRSIYLSNTNMEPADWGTVFSKMAVATHLEKLDLTWNKIHGAIIELVRTPTALSRLRVLTLRKAHMKLNAEEMILFSQWLGNLVDLEDLDLSENDIGEASEVFPDQLAKLTRLKRLNLSSTELSEVAFSRIGPALKNMPDLQQLQLSENDIGVSMVQVAEGLKELSQLVWLNLEDTLLNSEGLVALAHALNGMPKLKNLYLHGNTDIEVEGVEALFSNFPQVPYLESLEMRGLEVEYKSCSFMLKECLNVLGWRYMQCDEIEASPYVVLDKLNAESIKKVLAVVKKYPSG